MVTTGQLLTNLTMKNFLLSIAFVYGLGMSVYGAQWYFKDMAQLETAVQSGDTKIELRHRINAWGNVHTILMANLISVVALTGLASTRQPSPSSQKVED